MPASQQRKRKSAAERRGEILDATLDLAIRTSLHSVTIRDVAETAGIVPGLIHHYFHDRDELVADAFECWCDRVLTKYVEASIGLPPLSQLAMFHIEFSPGERRLWYDALRPAAPGTPRNLLDKARTLSVEYHRDVTTIIERGIALGDFNCQHADESAARIILVLDASVLELSMLSLPRPERAVELAGVLIDRELGIEEGSFAAEVSVVRSAAS